tara:strand:+ start:718 stop:1620 length:903 start_codon:yes stop_codon:yes gene_type:complete
MSRFIRFDSNNLENFEDSFNKVRDEVAWCYFVPPEKKKVCVDIGSNMGAFMHLVHQEDAFEEVYGFEPSFQTYHASLSILKDLDVLNENRRIFNLAVADKSGEIYTLFDAGDGDSGSASLLPSQKSTQKENCMSISLDDIFDLTQVEYIDYLKIDCEGAELAILKNSKRLKDIGAMMIECHYVDGVDTAPLIIELLSGCGFHISCFTDIAPDPDNKKSHTERMKQAQPVIFAIDVKTYQENHGGWYRTGMMNNEAEEIGNVSISHLQKHNNHSGNVYEEAYEKYQEGLKLTRNLEQEETN